MFKARKKEKGNIVIELDIDGTTEKFELTEPTFDVKAKAIETMIDINENLHMIKSGQVIFDACYKGDLVEVKLDDDVYLSLCAKVSGLVKLYEGDLKKN